MGAVRVCLLVLAADWAATVSSATFCQSTLYTDAFVCEDGSDVGANGCCAGTGYCPSSCSTSSWSSQNGVSTCTCTGCNYGFKLTSLTEDDRYLKAHNYFRCRHGQNALAWDSTVAASATSWADTCPSQGGNPAHQRPDGTNAYDLVPSCGENVAIGYKSPEATVEAWYNEITNPGYIPGTTGSGGAGHYTALIWAATTKLGCAQNACASGSPNPVHVCHYAESAPNFGSVSAYIDNVPQSNAETATEASCCTSVYDEDPDDEPTATPTASSTASPDDEPNPDADFATPSAAPRFMLWISIGFFARSSLREEPV